MHWKKKIGFNTTLVKVLSINGQQLLRSLPSFNTTLVKVLSAGESRSTVINPVSIQLLLRFYLVSPDGRVLYAGFQYNSC